MIPNATAMSSHGNDSYLYGERDLMAEAKVMIHLHQPVLATIHIRAGFRVAAHLELADHTTTVLDHWKTRFVSTDLQPWLYSSRESK